VEEFPVVDAARSAEFQRVFRLSISTYPPEQVLQIADKMLVGQVRAPLRKNAAYQAQVILWAKVSEQALLALAQKAVEQVKQVVCWWVIDQAQEVVLTRDSGLVFDLADMVVDKEEAEQRWDTVRAVFSG
jgi:hypothetical protein